MKKFWQMVKRIFVRIRIRYLEPIVGCDHNFVFDRVVDLTPVKGKKHRKIVKHCCKCRKPDFYEFTY